MKAIALAAAALSLLWINRTYAEDKTTSKINEYRARVYKANGKAEAPPLPQVSNDELTDRIEATRAKAYQLRHSHDKTKPSQPPPLEKIYPKHKAMIEAHRKKHPRKAAATKARETFAAGNENEPTKKPTAMSQLKKQASLSEGTAPSDGVAAADPSAAKQKAAKAAAQINAPARKRSLKVKEPPASGSARSAKPRSKKAPAAPIAPPPLELPDEAAAKAALPPAVAPAPPVPPTPAVTAPADVVPEPAATTPTAKPESKPTTEAVVPSQEQKEKAHVEKQVFQQTFGKFLTTPEAGTPKAAPSPTTAIARPTAESTAPAPKESNESNFSLWWKRMWK